MNDKIKQLAEQAGFMLWQDEAHNPGDVIDWAARYDDELVKYTELVVRECQDNLAWHGHDEAVSQLDWLKVNRFGIK